jgi:hypothetical protein
MANLRQLRYAVDNDVNAREAMFDYFYGNSMYGGMNEAEARIIFGDQLDDSAEARRLLNAYLPVYNSRVAAQQTPQGGGGQPGAQQQQVRQSGGLEKALRACFLAGAIGLITLIGAATTVKNKEARDFWMKVGGAATAAGVVGAAYNYTRKRRNP